MNSTNVEKEFENTQGGENYTPEDEEYLYSKAFKVNTKTGNLFKLRIQMPDQLEQKEKSQSGS